MSGESTDQASQADVVAFLASDATWGQPVERIDTHSAVVFLVGNRALKMKRSVRYSYLDFSTVDRRREACEAEVALNRRTAPDLYRGTVPVTREPTGRLALAGRGPAVEWLVDMVRFDQDCLLDRMAAAGRLDASLMPALVNAIAAFHGHAEVTREHGGVEGIERVIDGAAAAMGRHGSGVLDASRVGQWQVMARTAAARHRDRLDERRLAGFVRRCHGDLHLRNLVLVDGVPTLFDAVEFNDDISCIDVWYDLAFLLMDLAKRGLDAHANVAFNGYLRRTQDFGGIELLPLFLACRAAVRAMTSVTAARYQSDGEQGTALQRLAREYLELALAHLEPPAGRLVAIGGLSGSGKSTLARALAPGVGPTPGAVLLRSDEIRKSLCGVPDDAALGRDGYRPSVTARVYDAMFNGAEAALRADRAVVVDAVFARETDREAIEAVAQRLGAPFAGWWLDAPPDVLRDRVSRRTGDASDADVSVVEQQLGTEIGDISWSRVDATLPAEALARLVTDAVERSSHVARHPCR